MFRDMIIAGAALLEKNKALIDSLNVFPVPDGDTGTNMSMTMQSAVREVHALQQDATVSQVADAVSLGALKGARGNSGVILSQLFRGFSTALKGAEFMDASLLSQALTTGASTAYRAVMKPKEGTILTVSRMIAEACTPLARRNVSVDELVECMLTSGEAALLKTPDMLPVLKEAGVVDSGGKGLLTIYYGFKMVLDGEDIEDFEAEPVSAVSLDDQAVTIEDAESIEFGYCTEFFITHLSDSFREEDLDRLRDKMMHIGDSVVVAYDAGMVKVHVHSNAPGKILQYALRLGEVDKVKIENMREQNRELKEQRLRNQKEFAMIAVSAGEGLSAVFHDLGVTGLIEGGQTMNPSIEDIAKAVYKVNARNVFILPNNSNIILAAQQAAELSECNVITIPSKTIPQGIACAIAFHPDLSAEENTVRMNEALQSVISGSVTYAVRDTSFNGAAIRQGDYIGMTDGKITNVGASVDEVACSLLRDMIKKSGSDESIVTIFYGETMDEQNATQLADTLQAEFPQAEFIVQAGGQPLYYYYFSVE